MTAGIFCMPEREEREQKRHPSLYAIVLTIGCPTKIVLFEHRREHERIRIEVSLYYY